MNNLLLNENITSSRDVLSSEPLIESLIWKQRRSEKKYGCIKKEAMCEDGLYESRLAREKIKVIWLNNN